MAVKKVAAAEAEPPRGEGGGGAFVSFLFNFVSLGEESGISSTQHNPNVTQIQEDTK